MTADGDYYYKKETQPETQPQGDENQKPIHNTRSKTRENPELMEEINKPIERPINPRRREGLLKYYKIFYRFINDLGEPRKQNNNLKRGREQDRRTGENFNYKEEINIFNFI